MKCAVSLISLAAFAASTALGAQIRAHPIESTIDLLKELAEKVKQEGQTEEVLNSKFESWCSNSIKTLDSSIAAGETKEDELESTIASKTEHETKLKADIEALTQEIAEYDAAGKKADDRRAKTAELYTTSDADLEATITALDDAIAALKGAETNTNAAALAQVQTKVHNLIAFPLLLERLDDAGLDALFSSKPGDGEKKERPEILAKGGFDEHTKKYKFKSNSVTELLKELKMKFEDDRVENTKAETNSVNQHSLEKQARDSATQVAADAQEEKTTLLSDTQTALAAAKGALTDTQDTLKADRANLADTKKSCEMKKSEWAERSQIREHEIKAMEEAIKILAEVSGVRTEAPSNPVLPPSPLAAGAAGSSDADAPALLQSGGPDPKMMRAINLLREEARAAHSRSLEQFAEELKRHLAGPFDEVNNMIQKMIFRLMNEQKDEDNHKNWCDTEMSKTNASHTDKSEKITALSLKIEAGKASAEELATEITEANEMVATLTAHMAEAADIRAAGKEENAVAIKDAIAAQTAIAKATAVLEAHYKETGMMAKEAWEFLESAAGQPQAVELPEKPETWSSSYTGVADPTQQPGGVVTILKTISADFAKMEADTKAQEEVDQKAYAEEVKSCEIEKTRRSKQAEMKGQERARTLDKVASEEKSLKHVQDELATVEQYLKDLAPACIEGDSTYEDRKAARAAELSSLKEAQVILADAFKEGAAPAPAAAALLATAPRPVVGVVARKVKHVPIQQLRR